MIFHTLGRIIMTAPFTLTCNDLNQLILQRPDRPDEVDVRIRRAFPWSMPHEFISIRSPENKEILLIDHLADLPPALRTLIEDRLAANSFIPQIQRVENVDVRYGRQRWTVLTDRGPTQFSVQEREDIRFLNDGRFSIKDADGNIYELPPLERLDASSRKAVEPLL
jgi:hypothetical protein